MNISGSIGRGKVLRHTNEELNRDPTAKFGEGIVWGSMKAARIGNLEFFIQKYLNISHSNLTKSVKRLRFSNKWNFLQDNDPKHVAENVKLCR